MKKIKYKYPDGEILECYLIFEGDDFSLGLLTPTNKDESFCLVVLKQDIDTKYKEFSKDSWSNCEGYQLERMQERLFLLQKSNWSDEEYKTYLKLKEKYEN
jgi:hypothetical protein